MSKPVKKFINDPGTVIEDHLKGFARLFPALEVHLNYRTVVLKQEETSNVGLVSGGGGGHEPFAAGFVGTGMLSGATSGSVFTSPPPGNVLHAIKSVAKNCKGGVIVIIPNYTGDCLNFGLAIERAKVFTNVHGVLVDDDCALIEKGRKSGAGARGLAGLVFVFKIGGAMAASGHPINKIASTLCSAINHINSIGVCVKACSLPGQSHLFELADDEMEIGVGVHGEAGCERTKFMPLKDIVAKMLQKLLASLLLSENESLAVFINNLGGISKLEENIVVEEVYNQLHSRGYKILRMYAGHLMTSLEMAGVQITILKFPEKKLNEWLEYLDKPTDAPAWPGCKHTISQDLDGGIIMNSEELTTHETYEKLLTSDGATVLKNALQAVAKEFIANESKLNDLDKACGDGDCGSTLKNLADAVLTSHTIDYQSPSSVFREMASIAENKMGGTSGGVYSLFFIGVAKTFDEKNISIGKETWIRAIDNGIQSIMRYSKAQKGDRTMLDVMIPISEYLTANIGTNFKRIKTQVIVKAQEACEATKHMEPRVGRASYVNKNLITQVDAGAYAVQIMVQAIANTL